MVRFLSTLFALCFASTAYAQYDESITVSRILFDMRVTKQNGTPVTDLTAEDIEVEIGGVPARLVSLSYIDSDATRFLQPVPEPLTDAERKKPLLRVDTTLDDPRLVVVLVQTDFARQRVRMMGQMKFRTYAEELIKSFAPADRVAVFSFDSHLKFRRDFTSNKEDAIQSLRESIEISNPPAPEATSLPSLVQYLDPKAMKRATSSEQGLLLIADALRNIPGQKTLLLLGWGLGEVRDRRVVMRPEWEKASRAMEEARVMMIALDTTDAAHDLGAGMNQAARDTGGFYSPGAQLPHLTLERAKGVMSGRYELELVSSEPLGAGKHPVVVKVRRKNVAVLAPAAITLSAR